MFNLFKKKDLTLKIVAPCKGTSVSLKEVPDPTFAEEMIGKGAAIQPEDNIICSPVDGQVTMIFPTGHAIGLTSKDGVEVLVHIGLDTVNMKGEGFEVFVKEGAMVKTGDSLIKVDLEKIKAAGYDTIIPVVITNTPNYSSIEGVSKALEKGDVLITITK